MNQRQRKKRRKKYYNDIIEDVVMEISLDKAWRERLFLSEENKRFLISYCRMDEIPCYIKKQIFLFWSKEFPEITRYSGNNPQVY